MSLSALLRTCIYWGAQLVSSLLCECAWRVSRRGFVTEAESNHGTIQIQYGFANVGERSCLPPPLSLYYYYETCFFTHLWFVFKMDMHTHAHNIQAVYHTHKFNTLKTTSYIHAILYMCLHSIKGNTLLSSPSPILMPPYTGGVADLAPLPSNISRATTKPSPKRRLHRHCHQYLFQPVYTFPQRRRKVFKVGGVGGGGGWS